MNARWHTWSCLLLLALSPATMPTLAADPWFSDVTDAVGLAETPGFRLSVADVNGDLYPDILLHRQSNYGTGDVRDKQHLYLNLPGDDPSDPFDRTFVDQTAASGIRANRQGTQDGRHSDSAIFADVDNDGDLDMFTLVYLHTNYSMNYGTNDLLLNDGLGQFTLAPDSPFHLEPIHNSAAAVFVDYDNDGNIDLFVGNWYFNNALTKDQLYRGHGDGSFTNVTTDSGIGDYRTCIYGVAAWDWNNDGYQDLFAPSYSHTVSGSSPIHWRNNGDGTFTHMRNRTNYDKWRGYGSGKASFGSMPRDYDNDGDIDFLEILVHGYGDGGAGIHTTAVTNVDDYFEWEMFRVYDRDTEDPDIGHHGDHYASWFDLDNDGLADFALTESGYSNNRFYVFRQGSDNRFTPMTSDSGMNGINDENLPPHNVLSLDYDLDGDEDLLVGFANDTDGIQLWRNDIGTDSNWLVVTLEGGGGPGLANRSAVGARVELVAGELSLTREVYAGPGHHGPQMPLSLTFGLGQETAADSLTVHWPNTTQTSVGYADLQTNRFLKIREVCSLAAPPDGLRLDRDGADLLFHWDTPTDLVWSHSIYRDQQPDPAVWDGPFVRDVIDQDPAAAGIQHRDVGGAGAGGDYFYLITAVNDCGESPLR